MASSKLKSLTLYGLLAVVMAGTVTTIALIQTYNRVTRIDRSHSEVVVGEFVDAYLNKRDDARAALFACDGQRSLDSLATLRASIQADEDKYATHVSTVLGRSSVEANGNVVDIDLEFRRASGALTVKWLQRWRFMLKNDGGWRVCSAERLPDPTPTPTTQPTAG